MTAAFVYAAVRTPFGRFGGALAESAPTTWPRPCSPACWPRRRAWTPARSTRSSGATPTAPARTTATSAGWPCCWPACRSRCRPPRSTGSAGPPRRRDDRPRGTIETGDADIVARRRRGVDDPRAVGAAQAVARRSRPATSTAVSTTLGWRLVNRTDARGVDGLAGRGQRAAAARSTAISRERQDAFAARSHQLADAAWDDGLLRRPRGAGARAPTSTRDESIRPGSTAGDAGRRSSRRSGPTAPSPPATPRRSTTAPPRVLLGSETAARPDRRRPAGPDRRPRRVRARAAGVRLRAGRGGRAGARAGPASAGPTSARSSSTRRSPCSRWPASTPGGSTPRSSTPSGGAIAIGHPLGASGGRILGTLAKVLRERRRALGRGRDLHRRRPGPRRRRWRTPHGRAVMTNRRHRRRGRGGRRHRRRRDRPDRRLRHGRACRSS